MKTAMILVAFWFALSASAATQYQLTSLGQPVPGWATYVTDMNDAGWVVGYAAEPGNGGTKGFLWHDGHYRFFDDLGGGLTRAYGINNLNQVVGSYHSDQLPGFFRAFIWQGDVMQDLGVSSPNGLPTGSIAYAINDNGVVVGGGSASMRGNFYWHDGVSTILPSLPSYPFSQAVAVNNSNVVVGKSYGDNPSTAVQWENGTVSSLGVSPGQSFATKINDLGAIIGAGPNGWFLREGEQLQLFQEDFGPEDLNNFQEVVGGITGGRAAIYEDGVAFDLNNFLINPTENYLTRAYSINNQGLISGVQLDGSVFLLTPVPEPTALVPLALMLLFRKR